LIAWRPVVNATARDTVRVVRAGWWRMAVLLLVVSAASALLVLIAIPLFRIIAGVAPAPATQGDAARAATFYTLVATALQWLVTVPAIVLGPAAAIVVACDALAGRRLSLRQEARTLWRLAPRLFAGFFFFGIRLLLLIAITLPFLFAAFFATPLGVIALALYAFVPSLHRRWLWWIGLALIPFALVAYFSIRWSMWAVAVIADGVRAADSLNASDRVVRGRWLLTFAIITIGSLAIVLVESILVVSTTALLGGADDPARPGGVAGALTAALVAIFGGVPFAMLTALYFTLTGPRRVERGRS